MSLETFETGAVESAPPAGKSSADELALFHRTLAELCRARVPLPKALRLLQSDLGKGGLGMEVAEMAAEIEQGVPLADAYGRRRKHFPALYRVLIEVGMAAGDLPGVLDEIAEHASTQAQITERMRKALAYPMFAGFIVIVIGIGLIFYVSPIVTEQANLLYGDMGTIAIPPTWAVAAAGLGVVLLAAFAAFAFAWLRKPLDPGAGPRSIAFRIPLLGRLRTYAVKASFASVMALLTRRRLPLPQALRLAAAATDDASVRAQVEKMAARAREGADLTEAVRAGDLISPSILWLVEAAESSGSASDALEDAARIYRQRLDRAVDRLCIFATPLAELLVGLVVLAFAFVYVFPAMHFMDKLMG